MKNVEYCYLLVRTDELGNTRIINVYKSWDSAMYYCEKQCERINNRSKDDLQIKRLDENVYCVTHKLEDDDIEILYTFRIFKRQLVN